MPAGTAEQTDTPAPPGRQRMTAPEPVPPAFAGQGAPARDELLAAPLRWACPSRLAEPLKVAGKRQAQALAALGIEDLRDLLEHLPADSREARQVGQLRAGEQATVAVEVRSISARPVRRRGMRPLVEAKVFDESGSMRATFFNQPWLVDRYPPGTRLLLHGKPDSRGGFGVAHHALAPAGAAAGPEPAGGAPVAHYPASEGISSTQILTLVAEHRERLADLPEFLPAGARHGEQLPDRAGALAAMHFPRDSEDQRLGRRRLAYEELLLTQLLFLRRRARRAELSDAPMLDGEPTLSARWLRDELPFELTSDQARAVAVIDADMARSRPMQRLLLGDVGSGKTVVALHAMLRAVEHDRQAALMAPTETLAEQHMATIQRLLAGENVRLALLTGSTPAARRRDILAKLASGELSLIVGTHALIESEVAFAALGLVVIDEQHRFGVRQRQALAQRQGEAVHELHMTATPIPRTLALARYGDLDTVELRQLPAGRQPIATRLLGGERERAAAYEHLRGELAQGRQGYVVCPLVEQAPEPAEGPAGEGASELRAATEEVERLRAGELAGRRVGLLHGAMAAREKQRTMAAFAAGELDVLVATTVIEVGIDVPNATVMVIENADRFGISQLHQLRGRIGRGAHASSCFLVGPPGALRLRAMAEHSDGFRLAEIDLALRREGELVGTRQSGIEGFRIASLPDDARLLELARARAEAIMEADPELAGPEHALLAQELARRFGALAGQALVG